MVRDVRTYLQRVASRLSGAFEFEEFGTEEELYFWSLVSEIASREQVPNFKELVQVMDQIYGASVHCAYEGGDGESLTLFRQMVQSANVDRLFEIAKGEGASSGNKQEFRMEFEEQLQNLETQLPWKDDFRTSGSIMMSFGECRYLPLYQGDRFWGVYIVGPYVSCPEAVQPKLAIVGRLLAKWLQQIKDRDTQNRERYQESAQQELGAVGTGSLHTENLMKLFLGQITQQLQADGAAVLSAPHGEYERTVLSNFEIPDKLLNKLAESTETASKLEQQGQLSPEWSEHEINLLRARLINEEQSSDSWLLITGYQANEIKEQSEIEVFVEIDALLQAVSHLVDYRRRHIDFTDRLIDDYEALIRHLEKDKPRTYLHTPRVRAFALEIGKPLGLEEQELETLSIAAGLHDVGYAAGTIIHSADRMGIDLEHPRLGYNLIDDLPLSEDVKQGVLTHHEWIDGSGTPKGVHGEDIPWTGKVLGLAEFIVDFVEHNQPSDVTEAEDHQQKINELTDALVERADQQFDMLLVPHAVDLVKRLGWKKCLTLGTDTTE